MLAYWKEHLQILRESWKNRLLLAVGICAGMVFFLCSTKRLYTKPGAFFENGGPATFTVVLLLLCLGIVAILCLLGKKLAVNAVLVIALFGTFFSVLAPAGEPLDERSHYLRVESLRQGQVLAAAGDAVQCDAFLLDATFYSSQKLTLFAQQSNYTARLGDAPTVMTDATINHLAGNIFLAYIPQALVLAVGYALHLPALLMLYLARIANLLMYAGLVGVALTIVPCYKRTLAFLACFPMLIYMASSLNSDAATNGLAFLAVALLLRLVCCPPQRWTWRAVASYVTVTALLALTKLPYVVFLGLPLCLLPRLLPKQRKQLLLWSGSALLLLAAWSLGMGLATARTTAALLGQEGADVHAQIAYTLQRPLYVLSAIVNTIALELCGMYRALFQLGHSYAYYDVAGLFFPFVLVCSLRDEPDNALVWRRGEKGWLFTCGVVGVVGLVYLLEYLMWSQVGWEWVGGVQGRYFLALFPLLPVLLCAGGQRVAKAKKTEPLREMGWSIVLCCFCVVSVLQTFYTP